MKQNRIINAKNKEFEITDKENPFKDDKLGRQQYADVLSDSLLHGLDNLNNEYFNHNTI